MLEVLECNFFEYKIEWVFKIKKMILLYGELLIEDEKLMRKICK